MSSRAAMLLDKEDRGLRADRVRGVRTSFVRNNPFEWEVAMTGPEGTPWEGGIFALSMAFDETFDEQPPMVGFITVPFHPNIDMKSGRPRIPMLSDVDFCWRPGGLRALLTALRATLAEPLANYPPANAAAYKCWLERPRLYAQLARDCATASRRIAAGLPPAGEGRRGGGERRGEEDDDDEEVDRRAESDPGGGVPLRPPSDVSFENYYEQWRYVATSLPTDQTGCGRIIVSRSPRIKLTTAIVEEVTKRQHDILYGRFPDITKKSSQYQRLQKQVATERALRAARIFKLQKIYNLGELDQAEPAEEQVRITIPGVPGQSPFPLQKQPAASGAPPTREEEQAEVVVDSDRHPESQRLPDEFPAAAPKLDPPRDGDSVGGMERWEEEEADNLVQWSSSLDVKKFDEL